MRFLNRTLAALLLTTGAGAQAPDAGQEARYRALINELRCLVCQNQSISDSDAPLAEDLRRQVRSQIAAGRNDEEIKTYMTERYGEFVLYRPRFAARTLALWSAPALLVLVGLVAVLRFARRRSGPPQVRIVDEDAVRKVLER